MTLDDVQSRFVNEIALRGYDDKYIDRDEEREILQIAIQLGFGLEQARESMAQVCTREGFVLESALVADIRQRLEQPGSQGSLDLKAFQQIVHDTLASSHGKRTERDIQKIVLTVIDDFGLKRVKVGWFSNWHKRLKRELGLA